MIRFFKTGTYLHELMNDGFLEKVIGHREFFVGVRARRRFNDLSNVTGVQVAKEHGDIESDGVLWAGHKHFPVERRHTCVVHVDVADIIEAHTNAVHC